MRSLDFRPLLPVLVGCLAAGWAGAQDDREHEYRLNVDVGYRWEALFRGSRDLYRTQLDLGEGPKLFAAELYFAPASGSNQLLDRLQINLDSWGGEPYNVARIRAAKNGVYELDFHYQNSHYFSSIPSFANPLFSSGNLLSQHREDTSLRSSSLSLRLRPGRAFQPFVSYQRTTRGGPVQTTFWGDNDEFLLAKALDFSSDDLRGGAVVDLPRISFRIEQGARWYRDLSTFLAEDPQTGNSTRPFLGRQLFLDEFAGGQDVKSRAIPYSTAAVTARPLDSVTLQGRFSYSMADFRSNYYESLTGNFFSFPELRAFYSGLDNRTSGSVKQPNIYLDLSAQWQAASWLRLVERFRTHRHHISGHRLARLSYFNVDRLLATKVVPRIDQESLLDSFLAVNVDSEQFEAQVTPYRGLLLRGGVRFDRRELALDEVFEEETHVLLLGASYRVSSRNHFGVEYERGRADRPIFRTDRQDFDRVRLHARLSPFEKLELAGNVTVADHESDLVDFTGENRLYSARFTYRPLDRLTVSGQWERTRLDTSIPYLIPQTFTWSDFFFRELGNYGNFLLDLRLVRNSRLTLGYAVWGNSGDFPVNYHQPVARLEIPIGERVIAYGQWNYYDYNEKQLLFPQDYRTHLATMGFKFVMGK